MGQRAFELGQMCKQERGEGFWPPRHAAPKQNERRLTLSSYCEQSAMCVPREMPARSYAGSVVSNCEGTCRFVARRARRSLVGKASERPRTRGSAVEDELGVGLAEGAGASLTVRAG